MNFNPADSRFVHLSPGNPRYFELGDSCFIPIGANICFPRFETDEEKVFADYRRMMEKLAHCGGNYFRIWLSCPFFELEPHHVGEFDSRQRIRLERLLRMAAELHLRVKITLEHFRIIEGKYIEFFPGVAGFVKQIHHVDHGGSSQTMLEFFTLPEARAAFLGKLDYLAQYFRENEAVFAWELWNEINGVGEETPLMDAWMTWSEQMLSEARKRFPNHMVIQSLGSFDSIAANREYDWLCRSACDFVQVHRYTALG